ncbi:hypothetical protein SUGI_0519940 [Cryptomeria japonica]|nr:hypothetical protein SUGI_0519940 [Cryptomeria japonica]
MDPYSSWNIVWEAVSEYCTIHGYYGENVVRKVNESWEPECWCLPGFEHSPGDNRSYKAITDIKDPSNGVNVDANDQTRKVPITVFSFGAPQVGNDTFKDTVEELGVKVPRVVGKKDMVPKMPDHFVQ